MELYKKYRPKSLQKVVGNEETVTSLQNMLKRGTVPHTILFHGPSGCGKTTLARIMKKELDCGEMDFTELNCSDFRGIDTVRDIRSTMGLAPTAGKVRIWLMDEVHKMSNDGQNAALKMLEDTPSHVYFFLCTTDPQKLIPTVRNRCCEMPVNSLSILQLVELCNRVVTLEKLDVSKETIEEICTVAEGSARNTLVLLDKIRHLSPEQHEAAITAQTAQMNEAIDLCRALIKKESWSVVSKILKGLTGEPEAIRWNVLGYAKSVLLNKAHEQAYVVIDCFKEPFYDSKHAGLVAACFESIMA